MVLENPQSLVPSLHAGARQALQMVQLPSEATQKASIPTPSGSTDSNKNPGTTHAWHVTMATSGKFKPLSL
jgi:hypothetical protein